MGELEIVDYAGFYNYGFFGYGPMGDFKFFSIAHIIPLIFLAICIFLIIRFRDKLRNWKYEDKFRYIWAFVMIMCEMGFFWRCLYVGPQNAGYKDMLSYLPLQVCQWSCIFATFMMMSKSHKLYSYCYYVCFTFGLIPLFYPLVIENAGPTYFRYYQYWGEHLLPILSVVYMTFVHGYRPKYPHIFIPFTFLFLMGIICAKVNEVVPYANYFYLKTTNIGSFSLDFMPKSMFGRLFAQALLGIILFDIAYIPIAVERRIKNKDNS